MKVGVFSLLPEQATHSQEMHNDVVDSEGEGQGHADAADPPSIRMIPRHPSSEPKA